MPVKSLNSAVLRWPSREEVEGALQAWMLRHPIPGLLALGYFGSYARGDYGVGSDLDLLLVVESSSLPSWQRALSLPLEELPVPAEALVYTLSEWQALPQRSPRFSETLRREVRWLFRHPALSPLDPP
ncbi:nucleotidyltransferase domain-containing protein [Thermus sp. NEB1569]|uniref:nucleotidyltransferase domain-containing protein n=1 Tax=Thermus sp. NEB1569 TaxID=2918899 RepID=UPI001EFAE362|nr:nucleotidyltransferase domain-containing protein [Thermus sp. NEB1569]ULR40747.1 nucleotidyltransferase domain-containing protein [Thermus sp. NEB1569]